MALCDASQLKQENETIKSTISSPSDNFEYSYLITMFLLKDVQVFNDFS